MSSSSAAQFVHVISIEMDGWPLQEPLETLTCMYKALKGVDTWHKWLAVDVAQAVV